MQCSLESQHLSVTEFLKTRQYILIFLLFTPLTSGREWYTTLMVRLVPQRLFWDFSTEYRRGQSCSLMRVGSPTLLFHWNIVAMWFVFYYYIAITTDFADLFLKIMYSYPTLVFLREHIGI